MAYAGLIFDLDQTLVDTSIIADLRSQRKWPAIYPRIPETIIYPGILHLLTDLKVHKVPMVIVTSSPGTYCTRVLSHHKLPIDFQVCYHDTTNKKPHPEPMLKALSVLNLKAADVVAVGDDPKDVASANDAKIFNIACTWGLVETEQVVAAGANLVCATVTELRQQLGQLLSLRL